MTAQEHMIGAHFLALLKKRLEPLSVRVFGSRARGDAASDSDFDILVVVETLSAGDDRYVSECAWEAGFEHGIIVAPLVYSRAEYEQEAASSLLRAIEREGEAV